MPIQAATHRFEPDRATLAVRTGRAGAAAKAGHDLVLRVTRWERTLEVDEALEWTHVELGAHATSLRVHRATGGIKGLGDDDKAEIHRTIDDKLIRQDIRFTSTGALTTDGGARIGLEGDLTLAGTTRPIAFDVVARPDGSLRATAVVTQTAGHEALLRAVRGAQGARRGRDRVRRPCAALVPGRHFSIPGRQGRAVDSGGQAAALEGGEGYRRSRPGSG